MLLKPAYLAVLALVAAGGAAEAASFNCAKAKTPDEKAICASPSLSELDVKMATLYGVRMKLPMLMGARGADAACIGTSYQERIDTLSMEIDAAMQDYCVKVGICG